ncbi:MAG TPA: hypothetical protein VKD21_04410 [Acidimicrobiales bacterium]|nr:hypothetical protein [Acidimicrobiales bacterium]
MGGHWSIKSFYEDGNAVNDHAYDEVGAREWATRMLGVGGVTGVMLEHWEYHPDGVSRLVHREQVYA